MRRGSQVAPPVDPRDCPVPYSPVRHSTAQHSTAQHEAFSKIPQNTSAAARARFKPGATAAFHTMRAYGPLRRHIYIYIYIYIYIHTHL